MYLLMMLNVHIFNIISMYSSSQWALRHREHKARLPAALLAQKGLSSNGIKPTVQMGRDFWDGRLSLCSSELSEPVWERLPVMCFLGKVLKEDALPSCSVRGALLASLEERETSRMSMR